jgi:hypothetical protein
MFSVMRRFRVVAKAFGQQECGSRAVPIFHRSVVCPFRDVELRENSRPGNVSDGGKLFLFAEIGLDDSSGMSRNNARDDVRKTATGFAMRHARLSLFFQMLVRLSLAIFRRRPA